MGHVAQEYAKRLHARGHQVHVLTPSPGPTDDESISVDRLKGVRVGNAALVPSLFRRLRGYQLVHLHYPFFGGAEFVLARRLLHPQQRLVITYHMDATAAGMKGLLFRMHARSILSFVLSRADRILVSSSDYARHSLLARFDLLDRLEVHPFGVDMERFRPGRELELRRQLEIPADEPVLLFVGALDTAHHFKGLPVLFEALAGVRDLRWRLLVAGDGPLRPDLERMARSRGIDTAISFLGNVSASCLPRWYRTADLHVFPSIGSAEAFGLVVLEAAASGVPSIVSDLPGVRTVVIDGDTGLHVRPNDPDALRDAIQRLLRSADQRVNMARRARERAEREFAWPLLIERLERTYTHVMYGN